MAHVGKLQRVKWATVRARGVASIVQTRFVTSTVWYTFYRKRSGFWFR